MVEKYYTVRGERHSVRMARVADKVTCRALLKEGDYNYPYTTYVEYRWLPKEHFKPNTFYLYNNKLGLIEYKGSICEVTIIESAQMAGAFRDFFENCLGSVPARRHLIRRRLRNEPDAS